MPEQTLEDILGELQAGHVQKQILEAVKKIAFNSVNVNGDKVPKSHCGEIILKLAFENGTKADTLHVTPSVKSRIPQISGRGHAVFVEDGSTDVFFVEPKTGFISINPIIQDDAEYQSRGKVTNFNQGK